MHLSHDLSRDPGPVIEGLEKGCITHAHADSNSKRVNCSFDDSSFITIS